MEKIKLSQLFPYDEVLNGYGIFAYLSQLDTQTPPQPVFPLISDFINQDNNAVLDIDYEVGYSADKFLSPLAIKTLIKSLDNNGFTLEDFINGDAPVSYADAPSSAGRCLLQTVMFASTLRGMPLIHCG